MMQQIREWKSKEWKNEHYRGPDGYAMPYRLRLPDQYDCGERYPLVLFLHGAGGRGDDNEAQLGAGFLRMFSPESPMRHAIVVAPQCPAGEGWVDLDAPEDGAYTLEQAPESRAAQAALSILEQVETFCNVDTDRVYLLGLSMGGFGVWDMLLRHGSLFAAGVPISGGTDISRVSSLARIPLWIFHGGDDPIVSNRGSRAAFAMLKQAGAQDVHYTEYAGMRHNIWDLVFSDRALTEWLFSHSLEERRRAAAARKKQQRARIAGGAGLVAAGIFAALLLRKKQKAKKALSGGSAVPVSPSPEAVPQAAPKDAEDACRTMSRPSVNPRPLPPVKPVKKIPAIPKVKKQKKSILPAVFRELAIRAADHLGKKG